MFASRKLPGRVPKCSQAAGAVNSWQEIARLAACQTRRSGSNRPPSEGYQASIFGYKNAIPHRARYDS